MKTIAKLSLTTTLLAACLIFPTISSAQSGALDNTFGTGGIVTTPFFALDAKGKSVAIQSDGKLVVAGSVNGNVGYYEFAVARYNTDGSLDTTFDNDGMLVTSFYMFASSYANSVALQADGKIVVSGTSNNGVDNDFAVVRYNTNGSLDTTFDTDGKLTTDFNNASNDEGHSVAIQSDGKIVLVGSTYTATDYDFAAVRYDSDGSLDVTFDSDGKVTTGFAALLSDIGNAVAIQSDGKIVAAGVADGLFAVLRYNTNGSLDNTFDSDGKLTTDFSIGGSSKANALAIQSDGKIVVAGEDVTNEDYAVSRYNTNGSLDNTFDGDGKVTTDFDSLGADLAFGVAIQTSGKIVVSGGTFAGYFSTTPIYEMGLVRYNANGSLDNTFDLDGKLSTDYDVAPSLSIGNAVAIQSDDKIVAAGYSETGNASVFGASRYLSIPTGINDLPNATDVLGIYPNPTTGTVNIAWTGNPEASMTITNILGEEIFEQGITSQIDLSSFPAGIYFLNVYGDGNVYTQKLLVE